MLEIPDDEGECFVIWTFPDGYSYRVLIPRNIVRYLKDKGMLMRAQGSRAVKKLHPTEPAPEGVTFYRPSSKYRHIMLDAEEVARLRGVDLSVVLKAIQRKKLTAQRRWLAEGRERWIVKNDDKCRKYIQNKAWKS